MTFSGTGISVVVISRTATAINPTLTVDAFATLGSRNITVRNPDLGTGTCMGCLTIS